MKILCTVLAQWLYEYPQNNSGTYCGELEVGDVVLFFDDVVWIEEVERSQRYGGEVLHSWLVLFHGKFGWVCAWNKDHPQGFETISELAT